MSPVQRDWLAYVDLQFHFFGEIGRPDLIERLGVAPTGATRGLVLCREIVLHNIIFDGSNKIYRVGQEFSPLLEHALLRILLALSLGFGDGVNGSMQALLPCESSAAPSTPKMDMLVAICRGIHTKRPVATRYHSMSSGEPKQVIALFTLVGTGLCRHVQASDHKSREFQDFVITRIEEPTLPGEEPQANERPYNDIQWARIVELDSVPHPSAERPDIIKMDYGMTDGSIEICVRVAVVGYMLQH